MTKLCLPILISLVATLLTSSPAFGAKEIFERTKPHVNVGVQSGYPSHEYQSPLYREAYINKAGQPQRNLVVNKLRGAIKPSESVPPIRDIKSMNDELDNMDGGYISRLRVARDAEGGHAPGELFDGQYFINKSTHSTEQSNEPINGLWVDSDSDGYGDDTGTPSVPSRRAIRVGDVILDGFGQRATPASVSPSSNLRGFYLSDSSGFSGSQPQQVGKPRISVITFKKEIDRSRLVEPFTIQFWWRPESDALPTGAEHSRGAATDAEKLVYMSRQASRVPINQPDRDSFQPVAVERGHSGDDDAWRDSLTQSHHPQVTPLKKCSSYGCVIGESLKMYPASVAKPVINLINTGRLDLSNDPINQTEPLQFQDTFTHLPPYDRPGRDSFQFIERGHDKGVRGGRDDGWANCLKFERDPPPKDMTCTTF